MQLRHRAEGNKFSACLLYSCMIFTLTLVLSNFRHTLSPILQGLPAIFSQSIIINYVTFRIYEPMKLKVFSVLLPYIFPSLQSSRIINVFGRFEELFEI